MLRKRKKRQSQTKLLQVIEWLTGFDETKLEELIEQKVTFKTFFHQATLNSNAYLIKGTIAAIGLKI